MSNLTVTFPRTSLNVEEFINFCQGLSAGEVSVRVPKVTDNENENRTFGQAFVTCPSEDYLPVRQKLRNGYKPGENERKLKFIVQDYAPEHEFFKQVKLNGLATDCFDDKFEEECVDKIEGCTSCTVVHIGLESGYAFLVFNDNEPAVEFIRDHDGKPYAFPNQNSDYTNNDVKVTRKSRLGRIKIEVQADPVEIFKGSAASTLFVKWKGDENEEPRFLIKHFKPFLLKHIIKREGKTSGYLIFPNPTLALEALWKGRKIPVITEVEFAEQIKPIVSTFLSRTP